MAWGPINTSLLSVLGQAPRPAPTGGPPGQFKVEAADKPKDTRAAFDTASRDFGEALKNLPPQYKAEVRTIHQAVKQWASKEEAAGRKADRLSTFVNRVMDYTHQALMKVEDSDPDLLRRKDEHERLDKVFREGATLIDAYHAYVKDKAAK